MSSCIRATPAQPYKPPCLSPTVSDSHYDGYGHTVHDELCSGTSKIRTVAAGAPSSLHTQPGAGNKARIRTKIAASPPPNLSGLPMPTISPTSSKDDLSELSRRRFTSLAQHRSFWLSLYFGLNLTLTLYNKSVLNSFPFPYTLTSIHSLCAAIGGRLLLKHGVYRPRSLTLPDYLVLALFSGLYSINIAVSNASLELVTIPLHQVIRGTTPAFTIFLAFYLLDCHVTSRKLAALAPVVLGVGLATLGDYSCTIWGFSLTLFGATLAALKTVVTNLLQTPASSSAPILNHRPLRARILGLSISFSLPPAIHIPRLRLHPLDLLTRMSPFAFVQCLLYAYLSGELDILFHGSPHTLFPHFLHSHSWLHPLILAANGAIAFSLNVVSFEANRRAGAVAMGVASNVKQVLTILCAVSLFELSISRTNAAGILLTLVGGAWYAVVERAERRSRAAAP